MLLLIKNYKKLFFYKQRGMNLLDVMLALGIIATLTVFFVKMARTKPTPSLHTIVQEVNDVFQKAFVEALLKKKTVQVRFFFDEFGAITYIEYGLYEEGNNKKNNSKKVVLKNKIICNSFILNGKNEFDGRTREIWMLIYPEGYAQECTLSLSLENSQIVGGYQLNPFKVILEDETNEK